MSKNTLRTFRGGPLDGRRHWIPESAVTWVAEDTPDLEELLAASLKIEEGGLVVVPERVALYRLGEDDEDMHYEEKL